MGAASRSGSCQASGGASKGRHSGQSRACTAGGAPSNCSAGLGTCSTGPEALHNTSSMPAWARTQGDATEPSTTHSQAASTQEVQPCQTEKGRVRITQTL